MDFILSLFSSPKTKSTPNRGKDGYDFKIECEGQEFPCHRQALEENSSYFQTMFKSGLKESTEGKMVIKDAKAEDVQAMLQFFYTKDIPEKSAKTSLITLADRFDLPEMIEKVMEKLLQRFRTDQDYEYLRLLDLFDVEQKFMLLLKFALVLRNLHMEGTQEWRKYCNQSEQQNVDQFFIRFKTFPLARKMLKILAEIDPTQKGKIQKTILSEILILPDTLEIRKLVFGNHESSDLNAKETNIVNKMSPQDVENFLTYIKKETLPSDPGATTKMVALAIAFNFNGLLQSCYNELAKRCTCEGELNQEFFTAAREYIPFRKLWVNNLMNNVLPESYKNYFNH